MADRLRAARDARGLSQTQLAAAIGSQWQQVSRWERGVVEPRSKSLHALSEALRVRTEWLRTGEGPMEGAGVVMHSVGSGKTRMLVPAIEPGAPLIDAALLADCIRLVQNAADIKRKQLQPDQLASLATEVYAIALKQRAGEKTDLGNVVEFLLA